MQRKSSLFQRRRRERRKEGRAGADRDGDIDFA